MPLDNDVNTAGESRGTVLVKNPFHLCFCHPEDDLQGAVGFSCDKKNMELRHLVGKGHRWGATITLFQCYSFFPERSAVIHLIWLRVSRSYQQPSPDHHHTTLMRPAVALKTWWCGAHLVTE